MSPIFCPANGQLDVGRLRIQFDNISFNGDFINTITLGIQAWAPVLNVTIVNLNLTGTVAGGDYVIYAGNGKGARSPNNVLKVSYVTPSDGYLFVTDSISDISHEFGHLLGLADRYYEGYDHEPTVEGDRISVPMDARLFLPAETDYIPATNLMSNPQTAWTLTAAQRQSIFACQNEPQLPRGVVGLFDGTGSSGWSLPPTMYLQGGKLWTPDASFTTGLAIAGYALLGGMAFMARAGSTVDGNGPVKKRWNVRPGFGPGIPTKGTWFRHGKLYGGTRKPAGPRIHRQMMKDIGRLAAF